ncbi:MAG: type II toxin-antitoxin system RelE/ParE family toxin [Nitrospira sp.]
MECFPREIEEYETADGKFPFSEWLDALPDIKARARIRKRLTRVQLGNLGDCEPVGEGVTELKEHYGPGYRIYCGEKGATIIVLLCGGKKDSQEEDIARAKQYLSDYRRHADA